MWKFLKKSFLALCFEDFQYRGTCDSSQGHCSDGEHTLFSVAASIRRLLGLMLKPGISTRAQRV